MKGGVHGRETNYFDAAAPLNVSHLRAEHAATWVPMTLPPPGRFS